LRLLVAAARMRRASSPVSGSISTSSPTGGSEVARERAL
jgi:hypothetical protein